MPLLVDKPRVLKALDWLKQNNSEYHDVAIDKMFMERCVNVYSNYSHGHGNVCSYGHTPLVKYVVLVSELL